MTRLYKKMANILEQKLFLYKEFIGLLQREWDVVTEYSLEGLQEVIKKKEVLILKMQVLEESRAETIRSLSEMLGVPPEKLTVNEMVRLRKDPSNLKLRELRKRLMDQIEVIKGLNDKNRGLVNHSSLSLKQSFSFMYRADEEARSSYHADGVMREGRMQSRILNADA